MSKAVHRTLEAKLAALDGPEWDSSDEETPVIPLEKSSKKSNKSATSAPHSSKTKKKKGPKSNSIKVSPEFSRVIYLGHLPSSFEEPELRGFLQQFGIVTRLKLSRSKRTANSKGYAFCEFSNAKTAAIVADTMDNYLMSQKRLVCHVVPNDKIHPTLFDGHDRKWSKRDWRGMHREQVNQEKSAETMHRITKELLKRERKKRQKLKEMGIDYDFPGYKESAKGVATKVRRTQSDGVDKESSAKKRRKVSVEDEENASSNGDDDSTDEKEARLLSTKKANKQLTLSDASVSSKVGRSKVAKRKSSDASLDHANAKLVNPANTPKPLRQTKKTTRSAEQKKSKKASKKQRRVST